MAPLGAHHPDVRRLRTWLRDARARERDGVFVAEGPRTVAALLERARRPAALYIDVDDHRDLAARVGEDVVRWLVPGVAQRVGDVRTTQGCLAVFERVAEPVRREAAERAALLLVLVRVNDPGNLGTIARSADAAGFDAIVVGPGSVDPYNPKAVRAGAGAIDAMPIWEGAVQPVLEGVAARGGACLAADARGEISLDAAPLTATPLAIVLGHETAGLGQPGPVDGTVAIPMRPSPGRTSDGPESLNLAMAATVLCFETARRRRAS